MASSSLSFHWEKMKLLAIFSFGIKKQDFIKIKLSNNKQGREENVSAINKDQYLKAANLFYAKGQYEDALLIHIMWTLASRPNEILTLRFWRQRWTKICFVLCKQEEPKEEVHYLKNFKPKLWTLKRLK